MKRYLYATPSLVGLVLLGANILCGQESGASTGPGKSETPAEVRDAMSTAVSHGRSGNPEAAEIAVSRLVHARPGTAAWHLEVAQHLLQVTAQMPDHGYADGGRPLVNRVIEHIVAGEGQEASAATRAALLRLHAKVAETFLDDRSTAKNCYERAVALNPSDLNAAEGLRRLASTNARSVATK